MDESKPAVACNVCLKEIPRSVAKSEEGSDRVYYFCGDTCYQEWLATPDVREVSLAVGGLPLEFEVGQELAKAAARSLDKEATLIAWYDRKQGKESPQRYECHENKPGWLAYAEGHGGNFKVDINQGEYIFVFVTQS
ncbi:MAG: AF1514 family protein [Candidatus Nitricoxidivorans perseverans]|uniref:AF1514 family protein n=1 Tax=Candidatus Nitricoxidivorans perseverans TaxID=2975601 RepID=A0AA49IWK8_9PROT|nr:MAG: AF1514 family protein [Candidatus Nitricoxidivorans perseverans]